MLDEFWLDMFGSYMSLASLRPGLDQKSRGLSGVGGSYATLESLSVCYGPLLVQYKSKYCQIDGAFEAERFSQLF